MARVKQSLVHIKKKKKPSNESNNNEKVNKIKKPHRFRPGTVAKREIRKLTQSVHDLIPNAPFQRLVRDIASQLEFSKQIINNNENLGRKPIGLRFKPSSIEALKAASQDFIINMFEKSDIYAKHAKRETIMPDDINLYKQHDKNLNPIQNIKTRENRIKNTTPIVKKKKKNIKEKEEEKQNKDDNNKMIINDENNHNNDNKIIDNNLSNHIIDIIDIQEKNQSKNNNKRKLLLSKLMNEKGKDIVNIENNNNHHKQNGNILENFHF